MISAAYRGVLSNTQARRLLLGLGVSALGDGMSMVSVAWLAVLAAPAGNPGVFVGLAVAAYTLPGAAGALVLSRFLRRRAAWALVVSDTWLRAGSLAAIALLWAAGSLGPVAYLGLLAGSSMLSAWGNAGQYTRLSELGGPDGRLAANSLYTAQASLAVIAGPALAGLLVAPFIPLTYALLQSSAAGVNLPVVLAARSAIIMVASPLGTAAGGPIVATLGAAWTLTASGAATVVLAVIAGMLWTRRRRPSPVDRHAPTKAARPAPPASVSRIDVAPPQPAPPVK